MEEDRQLIKSEINRLLVDWPDTELTGPVTAVLIEEEGTNSRIARSCVLYIEEQGLLTVTIKKVNEVPGLCKISDGRFRIGTSDALYRCPMLIIRAANLPDYMMFISGCRDNISFCGDVTTTVRDIASRIYRLGRGTQSLH